MQRSRKVRAGIRFVILATFLIIGLTAGMAFAPSAAAQAPAPDIVTLMVKLSASMSAADRQALMDKYGATVKSDFNKLGIEVVEIPADNAATTEQNMRLEPGVLRVEESKTRKVQALPNDAQVGSQWSLPQIAWDQVYGTVTPQYLTKVAILDTGVDATHTDLMGSLTPGTSIIDTSNGLTDLNGHGTWLAGIVAARTNNIDGIAGVGFSNVQVMPVKVADANGDAQDDDVVNGVMYAVDNGASVILMAFSNPGFSASLQDAIDYAWSKNVVLVAAVGNDGSSASSFPAGDRGVMGVSATDQSDNLAAGSNYGGSVFIAAPGVSILGTGFNNTYVSLSGTSASAAIVAGAAALMRAVDPTLPNGVVVNRLASTADPAGTQEQTGNGRVQLARAIADTDTTSIEPAGDAPVGGSGPFVGPYHIANKAQTVTVASPTSVSVVAGSTAAYGGTTVTVGGNSGSCVITLAATGLPAGASPVFGTNPLTSTGPTDDVTASFSVSTTAATTPGSYPFNVTATDGAGCQDTKSQTSNNLILVVTAPLTVTINQAAAQNDPTKNSTINFTVIFSASVSDFATGDVTLSGTAGATTGTVTGSGTTYNVAVSGMTSNGTVIASIAAGKASSGGNANLASTSTDNTVTYDTTAPVITITFPAPNGSNGWNKTAPVNGSVSATDSANVTAISCSDTLGGLTQGSLSGGGTATASATLSVTGEGTHNISCTATDGVGNAGAGTGSTTMPVVVKIDTIAPTISSSAKTADNNTYTASTWTNQNVTVTFTCSDSGSGLAAGSPPAPTTVSSEGSNLSASGTCTDNAGNSASNTFDHIQIDKTAPTSSASPSPAPNGAGWNNSDLTVTLSATDNAGGSGVKSITYSANGDPSTTVNGSSTPVLISSEGINTINFHATDNATNIETPDKTTTIKLDKTPPTVALLFPHNGSIVNAAGYNSGCGSAICGNAADSGGSGVQKVEVSVRQSSSGNYWSGTGFTNASQAFIAATGTLPFSLAFPASNFPADGTYLVDARATDNAGNVTSAAQFSFTYDNTPPVVTISFPAPVHGLVGWFNAQDTVPVVGTVTATDPSPISAISCTDTAGGLTQGSLTIGPGPIASRSLSITGDGTHNISCTATDAAGTGNTGAAAGSTTMPVVIKIDTTAPTVTAAASRAPDQSPWYNHALTVSFSATDATSGLGSCDAAVPYSGPDSASASVSGHCTDAAGNQGTGTLNFKYDAIAPTIAFVSRTAPNANGWNKTDVMVNWSCADTTSGPVSASVSQTVSTEGNNQSSTGNCTDNAGNTASDTQTGINIDKTAPTLTFGLQSPAANANGWNKTDVSFSFTPADALSGVDTTSPATSPLVLTTEGSSVTGTVTVTDKAGNSAMFTSPAVKIDKTAPTLSFGTQSPAANANGWNNTNVSFPFTPSDTLSGVDTTNPAASPLLLTMEGSAVTGTVTVTDKAGNSAMFTSPAVKIDKTAPTITFVSRTPPNANGWNNTDVTVNWSCTDGLSGAVSASVSQTVTTEGNNQSSTGTCTDLAGNTASDTQTGINIDRTPPTISGSRAPLANANGWNNTDVTASFTCMDTLSGLAAGSPPAPTTVSTEGAGQSVNGTCFDKAGNSASTSVNNINIDKTLPTASAAAAPAPNVNGWNNTNVTVTFTGNDSLSGIDFCSTPVVLSTDGANQSASGTCTDKAGNVSTTATASGINIDKTLPTLSFGAQSPAANVNGWNNTNVSFPFTAADALSGVASTSPAASPLVLSTEGSAVTGNVSVTDKAGNTAMFTSPAVKIDKTVPTVGITNGPANPTSSTSASFTFMEGDTLSGVGSVSCKLDGGMIAACSSYTAQSYSGLLDGSHTFVVYVTDNAGNLSSASYMWVVDTKAPIVSAVTLSSYAVPIGGSTIVTLNANVSDATTGNSNISSAQYTVAIGSGIPSAPISMTITSGSGTPTVTAKVDISGLFTTTNVLNICVSGTDAGGNTSVPTAAQCAILAVYDPSAGFVTGGGWIMSMPGAYIPDPTLAGKANFGFVSQYKKGATVPTGNTQFQFQEGNLDFESTAFQWLVVSGSKAQFQGTGTINGTGSYGFQIFAYDGSVKGAASSMDGFRIQIGTLLSDGTLTNLVYDNKFVGTSSPGSGTEPLDKVNGNGSIQIH